MSLKEEVEKLWRPMVGPVFPEEGIEVDDCYFYKVSIWTQGRWEPAVMVVSFKEISNELKAEGEKLL